MFSEVEVLAGIGNVQRTGGVVPGINGRGSDKVHVDAVRCHCGCIGRYSSQFKMVLRDGVWFNYR